MINKDKMSRTGFIYVQWIVMFLLIYVSNANGQDQQFITKSEKKLMSLSDSMNTGSSTVRTSSLHEFNALLEIILADEASFNYPFDSLKSLSKLTSKDKRFRIYTWLVPSIEEKHYKYFGIIQVAYFGNNLLVIRRH